MLNMTKKQRYTLEHELGNIYSFNDYLKSFTSSLTCNDALMLDFIENIVALLNELYEENEQLKQRINSRLHFYRELYESTNDNVVKRVIEDLEDILK